MGSSKILTEASDGGETCIWVFLQTRYVQR